MGGKTKCAMLSERSVAWKRGVSESYGVIVWNGQKNEKYIYLDFAWIFGAVGWIGSWIDIVLLVVVLVARPFLLPNRLSGAFDGRYFVKWLASMPRY